MVEPLKRILELGMGRYPGSMGIGHVGIGCSSFGCSCSCMGMVELGRLGMASVLRMHFLLILLEDFRRSFSRLRHLVEV